MSEMMDRLAHMHDLLNGIVSEEMALLLADPEIGPEELSEAVLSSSVSLQDKELKLGLVTELVDSDEGLASKSSGAVLQSEMRWQS